MKRALTLLIAPALLGLAACSEPSQELHSNPNHKGAYQGTGSNFVVNSWNAGDRNGWEQALKVRAQRGQNEYNKTNRSN